MTPEYREDQIDCEKANEDRVERERLKVWNEKMKCETFDQGQRSEDQWSSSLDWHVGQSNLGCMAQLAVSGSQELTHYSRYISSIKRGANCSQRPHAATIASTSLRCKLGYSKNERFSFKILQRGASTAVAHYCMPSNKSQST